MLRFLPFKSKSFINVSSIHASTKYKRYISVLQTIKINDHYMIHHKCHVEERENRRILPAIISNGNKSWFKNGAGHRDDLDENGRVLPATIWSDGSQFWYKNGFYHRNERDENGRVLPAIIWSDGSKCWYTNGLRRRIFCD